MPKKEVSISELISKDGLFNDGDWIESKDQDSNGEVKLIQLADIGDGIFIDKSNRFLSFEKANKLKCTFLRKGDILVARMPDPIGRACVFPGNERPCVTVVDVAIIRPNNPIVHNEWLKYKINSPHFRHLLREFVNGTTRVRISRKNLDKIKFSLPEYSEQLKIAHILSKSEQTIINRTKTIENFNDLIEAQFGKLFGDIGLNTKNFSVKPLSKITTKIGSGSTPKGGKEVYLQKGSNYFLRSQNIRMFEIDFNSALYISSATHIKMKNTWVKYGDVLLTITGASIGRVAYYEKEDNIANVNQHVCIIRPIIEEVDPVYLCYCMGQGNYQQKILSRNVGGTRQAFNFDRIYNFEIPLPLIDDQKEFHTFVSKVEKLKSKAREYLEELKKLTDLIAQKAFDGMLKFDNVTIQEKSPISYSAFQDRPELAMAAMKGINQLISNEIDTFQEFSSDEKINIKIKQLEFEKSLNGTIPLDIDYLKYTIATKFKIAFRCETLQKYLSSIQIEFSYDMLVNTIFELLKGKKPFLKQQYFPMLVQTLNISDAFELIEQEATGLHFVLNEE
jgi:type I restriction enzyme S subunit